MSQKILKLADQYNDFASFEIEGDALYVVINNSTSIELTDEDVNKLKNFLEEMFPSPETQAPAGLGCMQNICADGQPSLVMDSQQLPANITLNVTGNVTINN
ncbi:hypothetical protein vB_PsyM_KIL3b_0089 [Pseudomonas phage vB_PsyM_KIL3b]|uniref:Uncharacterized protein n=2 Tax=Pseudomonas phage vB_PsyM_KIL1 TaxID=1777065 RepID=A0A142IFZ9_9CAUD|nr:hypothetical protein vB_PsyM_KIL3_0089 [Pseudomonas phage vB_PsyM_KIL3]AMR58154.1 hypothetical protein vB_PsyM_KIL3b_0089 [Pseudomonas phage vB_PsyM_KIL3b]